MSLLATALTVVAIVTQDQAALRAAPRESAVQQAVLWQGDSLEIRATKGDYLQVYDHRRERAGYIRASQVRQQALQPENAPELLAIVRFLRDTPGAEALGIGYAAAYLKAAPADAINAEVFDALGTFAERLAKRATVRQGKAPDTSVGAHLEVAAAYGVRMVSFEREEQVQICYNGDAFRRVLALPASGQQKALAALALTRHDCVAPALTPTERLAVDHWRAEVLDRVETTRLPEVLKNRLHLRRAGVWASLAWQRARRSEVGAGPVTAAGKRAVDELAAINRSELAETDAATYSDAAIRVGASRWAAEPAGAVLAATAPGSLGIATSPGQPGETCVHLVDSRHDARHSLLTRCTYGIVWTASAAAHPQGTALALAVQPLDGWREMWVFRQEATGWKVDVVPPATVQPTLGYVEFAGWVPGSGQMLTAREAKVDGRYKLSFELLNPSTLEIDRWADKPASLSAFQRWQAPAWKARTVSIR